jgi:hypothetical protein
MLFACPVPIIRRPMKPSRYNIYVEYDKVIAVYNTLQQSLATIPADIYKAILGSSQILTEEQESTFKDLGFLVDENSDEINLFRMRHESILHKAETLSITHLLTTRCNCRCVYCYEEGYRENEDAVTTETDFDPVNIPAYRIHTSNGAFPRAQESGFFVPWRRAISAYRSDRSGY